MPWPSNLNHRIWQRLFLIGIRSEKTRASPAALRMGTLVIAALLADFGLRLLRLTDAATAGFVGRLLDLAHVIAILDHVRAAEAILVVNLCHH